MKRYFWILLLLCFPLTAAWAQSTAKEVPFTYGEDLHFEVTYGWVDLAEGRLHISKKAILENSQSYYKIDAFGKTKGAVTLFSKVNDNWGTHLHTQSLLPGLSYRHIEEGRYRRNEKVYFDQVNKKATLELYDRENKKVKETKVYSLPGTVQDLVSGFYFLRTLDLSSLKKGQEVLIRGFFDKEIYNLKLIFGGTEMLETNLGRKETYLFSPQIPKNSLFRGEYPVRVWITKDVHKIPVKIKADLFIGSLNIDITTAKGLKN
ncbi:MAG: DUF3108 domain-containing protein [Algoriphagus sp.]|nr:DUF3108 domain-containing protein [Algoriphagus sp.]